MGGRKSEERCRVPAYCSACLADEYETAYMCGTYEVERAAGVCRNLVTAVELEMVDYRQ